MAAQPQWPGTPLFGSALVTAGNTSSQGGGTIGTDIFKIANTGASGSYVDRVEVSPTATTPTTTTATVCRVFFSTVQSGTTTSSNTFLLGEITLPAISADNATAAVPKFTLPLQHPLPANGSILVTNHAAPAANSAWRANVIGGDL
jgi:hypothetical protein